MNARELRLARDSLRPIAEASRKMPGPWVGTSTHRVNPNTVDALERLGWVRTRWSEKPRRLTCKPTAAGLAVLAELEVA